MNEKLSNMSHSTVRSVERLLINQTGPVTRTQWYVVQTKPQQEVRALEQLRQAGCVCFLPTVPDGRVGGAAGVEPRFARYLLVQLEDADSDRPRLLKLSAVSGLLLIQRRALAVPPTVVADLLKGGGMDALFYQTAEHDAVHCGSNALATGGQLDDGVTRALLLIELLSQPQLAHAAPARMRRAA